MSKKSNRRKQGHPARHGNVLQFPGRGVAVAQLKALTSEFVEWAVSLHGADAGDAAEDWDMLVGFAEDYSADRPLRAIDAFSADAVAGILHAAVVVDAGSADYLAFVLEHYLDFLAQTGRWTRSPAELEELHAVVEAVASLPSGIPHATLGAEEAWDQWREMPLVRRGRALLEWVGTGRDITSTQALRLKEVEGAAATVGIHARGVPRAKRPLPATATHEPAGTAESPFEVGSMYDVPSLPTYWAALVDTGLVELSATQARPGARAALFASTDPGERVDAACLLALGYIVALTDRYAGYDDGAGVFLTSVLAAAAAGAPVSAEVFDVEAALERMREQDRSGEADDAEYSRALSGVLAVPILREAREAGLLVPHGDGYTVPRVAAPAIGVLLEGMQEVGSLVEFPDWTPEARGGQ